MKSMRLSALPTVVLFVLPVAQAFAIDAAQIIFSNNQLTVINAAGIERKVKQGDFIQPGERLITPPGVMSQLRLPDGTLLGARPGTDLKLETIVGTLKNVLVLNEGNVRVINVESQKGPKPLPTDIVSPVSTLQLKAGDGESIHIKAEPGGKPVVDPGTYNRLQFGVATMHNAQGDLPLAPLQSGYVRGANASPSGIAALPTNIATTRLAVTPAAPRATTAIGASIPAGQRIPGTISVSPFTSQMTIPSIDMTRSISSPATALATAPATINSTPLVRPTLTPSPITTMSTLSPVRLTPPPPPPPPIAPITTTKRLLLTR